MSLKRVKSFGIARLSKYSLSLRSLCHVRYHSYGSLMTQDRLFPSTPNHFIYVLLASVIALERTLHFDDSARRILICGDGIGLCSSKQKSVKEPHVSLKDEAPSRRSAHLLFGSRKQGVAATPLHHAHTVCHLPKSDKLYDHHKSCKCAYASATVMDAKRDTVQGRFYTWHCCWYIEVWWRINCFLISVLKTSHPPWCYDKTSSCDATCQYPSLERCLLPSKSGLSRQDNGAIPHQNAQDRLSHVNQTIPNTEGSVT